MSFPVLYSQYIDTPLPDGETSASLGALQPFKPDFSSSACKDPAPLIIILNEVSL